MSRLIPTNSVYEQPYKNDSPPVNKPSETQLRSLDENNVMETSKTIRKHDEHEVEVDEEAYQDEYETDADSRAEHEASELSKITDTAVKRDKSLSALAAQTENTSRDEDYVEDPSTSQYDAYYYYDDYENTNRSRYEAVGKTKFELDLKRGGENSLQCMCSRYRDLFWNI